MKTTGANFKMSRIPKAYYNAVNNYLCNSLQISRYFIENLVNNRVEKIATRLLQNLLNAEWFRNRIDKIVRDIIKEGIKDDRWGSFEQDRTPLINYIEKETKKAIKEKILDSFELDVKIKMKCEEEKPNPNIEAPEYDIVMTHGG